MAISKVQICNMALSHIGASQRIESIDELSPPAKACKLWYDLARKQALEAYDWSFARRRAALALHGDDPPDDWAYRYVYPADCIKALSIVNVAGELGLDAIPFHIEVNDDATVKTILSNYEEAILRYTFDVQTVTLFSLHFVETLSRNLASKIAFTLTGKQSVMKDQFAIYMSFLRMAPAQNANEQVEPPPREAEWIRGRQ